MLECGVVFETLLGHGRVENVLEEEAHWRKLMRNETVLVAPL